MQVQMIGLREKRVVVATRLNCKLLILLRWAFPSSRDVLIEYASQVFANGDFTFFKIFDAIFLVSWCSH